MTDTNFRGPVNNLGAMEDAPASISPTDGPSGSYQGQVILDLRGGAFNKDGIGAGRVPGYLDNPRIVTVDNIPSAATTTILAVAAATVSGTAATLVTVAPGNATAGVPSIAPGMPIIPFGASAVSTVIALDFGFTTGTTTAGASTVVVVDNTLFTLGQWIAIGGAANSGKTASLITQVVSIVAANTTGITVSPTPLGSLVNAPIGSANLWNQFTPPATQFGPGTVSANAASNRLAAGLFRLWNPLQAISRNIAVATITGATGTFTVNGFDVHSQAMSETISVAAGTATVYGKKTFKYIASVVPNFTDATGTYSIGIGDTFGFPIRADRWESVDVKFGGIVMINQTGFLAPDLTSPALATTGDVRGVVQTSAKGAGTSIQTALASNGVVRLFVAQTIPLWNDISGTPLNTVPIFGQTQA